MNPPGAIRINSLLATAVFVLLFFATPGPIGATPGPSPSFAFPLMGDRVLCTGFYWRPVPEQPGRSYFLSAGHCWQQRYATPESAHVVWAKVPGDRPTFVDFLVGETRDPRIATSYFQEFTETPRVGDVHLTLVMKGRPSMPRFESLRLTFKRNLDDVYVYDADDCVSPGYSGAPVFTEDQRLVGVAILGNSRLCKRVYVVPMSVLYSFRPDLRP